VVDAALPVEGLQIDQVEGAFVATGLLVDGSAGVEL